jgi:hypothetical protein
VIKNGIIGYFAVCAAVYRGELGPAAGLLDAGRDALAAASPFVTQELAPFVAGMLPMSLGVLLSFANLAVSVIGWLRAKAKIDNCERFLRAFGVPNALGRIKSSQKSPGTLLEYLDNDSASDMAHYFARRYSRQLDLLTFNDKAPGGIDPQDGVVILAEEVVARICAHIIRGLDENEKQRGLGVVGTFLSNVVTASINSFKDNESYESLEKIPLRSRCLLAVLTDTSTRSEARVCPRRDDPHETFDPNDLLVRCGLEYFNVTARIVYHFSRSSPSTVHQRVGYCITEDLIEVKERLFDTSTFEKVDS